MVRLLDTLDRARRDPDEDIHFAMELESLFDTLENQDDLTDDARLTLSEMEGDYPLPEIVDDLEEWYGNEDFQSAIDCLNRLESVSTDAENESWLNVTAQYHYRRILLRSVLSGHDASDEIEESLDFLENNHPGVTSNFIIPLIHATMENIGDIKDAIRNRWITLIEELAHDVRSSNQFDQWREYLRLLRQFRNKCSLDTSDVEQELIEAYRIEADAVEHSSQQRKADTLLSGIRKCGRFMSNSRKQQWKQEAFRARRSGIQEELVEIDYEDLEGVDQDALMEEMERNTESIIDWFGHVKEASGSASYALYCLLLSQSLFPDVNQIRLSTEEFVLSQLLQRKVYSPEAYSVSIDPTDIDSIPNQYDHYAVSKMSSLGNALHRLIMERRITLADLFQFFWISPSISPDTEAFLTDSLLNLFEESYRESLFLSIPHLEATLVDSLWAVGRPPYSVGDEGSRQRLLGGLFIESSDIFGEHYSIYLRYRYTDRVGMNLRNRLSHGQLRYRNGNYLNAILTIFDILRIVVKINISWFLEYFGIPQKTLSPATNYGNDLDLSLYTDLNKQIIGYGRSQDQHTIIVIRENPHEERTELYVDRGTINRYLINDIGLTREDLEYEIEQKLEGHSSNPDEINYTWLDKDDLILHIFEDVLDENLQTPADSVRQDSIFTQAKEHGIDESTSRTAIRVLEEQGDILTTEILDAEHILRSNEQLAIFDTAQNVEGVGDYLAWSIAENFDDVASFENATVDELQEVDGIGLVLAEKVSEI